MTAEEERLAKAQQPALDALRLHPLYHGKVQMLPKCPIRGAEDFAVWYTPGVAAVCKAIAADPAQSFENTNRANSIAIVYDGTRVLGLGDIGPAAGMPVMEGKALLFKYLGGVDAVPLCVATHSPDELITLVKALEPSFGGINLEDIAQPKCFAVLDALRAQMNIPVWHDDQQGTATVVLAGLLNALRVVGKELAKVRIALVGVGAANIAVYRLLKAVGASPAAIIAVDRQGVLHAGRDDLARSQATFVDKWRICRETNAEGVRGGVAEALRGADVCLAFSSPGPDLIRPEWVRRMAPGAILFACANPTPEIWPWVAKEAGARVVATGRSDFPNQVNNSLGFPGIFRGALDVRAKTISDEMALAAARELAACVPPSLLSEERIVPRMEDAEIHIRVAVAAALAAQQQNLARLALTADQIRQSAAQRIAVARESTHLLMREDLMKG